MEDKGKKKDDKVMKKVLKALAATANLGTTMAVCVIIGVLIGKRLDEVLNTAPIMLLIFSMVGVVSSLKVMYDIHK